MKIKLLLFISCYWNTIDYHQYNFVFYEIDFTKMKWGGASLFVYTLTVFFCGVGWLISKNSTLGWVTLGLFLALLVVGVVGGCIEAYLKDRKEADFTPIVVPTTPTTPTPPLPPLQPDVEMGNIRQLEQRQMPQLPPAAPSWNYEYNGLRYYLTPRRLFRVQYMSQDQIGEYLYTRGITPVQF